jgi:hypothetical protein
MLHVANFETYFNLKNLLEDKYLKLIKTVKEKKILYLSDIIMKIFPSIIARLNIKHFIE